MAAMLVAVSAQAQVAVSDDFRPAGLNDAVWTFVDPIGDCSLIQTGGQLTLTVPGGTAHDIWEAGNETARIVQPVADLDLGLEVKFESEPVSPYQIQGLLLEASPGNYIRVDYFHDGASLHLFGASFVADAATVRGDVVVPSSGLLWVRVVRTGDDFTVTWSDDGAVWQTGFSFTHSLALSQVGVYAGNAGSPAPAFDAVVDYFFDMADPIDPEDGDGSDIWPPLVSNVVVVPDNGTGTATVTCTTNEPATTVLSFGPDANYGTDVAGTTSGGGLSHQFTLTGLVTDATYHFSILATDTLANSAATPDQQFQNTDIRPVFSIWSGPDQRVGNLGPTQADFNLLGSVTPWEDLATLEYSLNGGPYEPLNWGLGIDEFGDHKRLARNGDFNVDLPVVQMDLGPNTITVRAMLMTGQQDSVVTTVTRETGSSPLPLGIDWSTVTDPQDVGQIVDGSWALDGTGLRTTSTGYDRLFMLGDTTWQDYEVTCPITIHDIITPTGPRSGEPGLGFLMRFTGHIEGGYRNWPEAQPKYGYQPFGGLGWLRWLSGPASPPTVQFYHGDYDVADSYGDAKNAAAPFELPIPSADLPFGDPSMTTSFGTTSAVNIGETFFMKMRCETLPDAANGDGVTRYSYKVWASTESEPASWNYEFVQQSQYALRDGPMTLLAHYVDVTFGDVTVVDLSGPAAPVATDDAAVTSTASSVVIDVLANDSDSDGVLVPGSVLVGATPLNGTITGIDPVTGAITYLHDGGTAEADSFTYTVEDDEGLVSNVATVRVTIVPESAPVAADDAVSVVAGTIADFDILANDTDVGGTIMPATVTIVDTPGNGTITSIDTATGIVTYDQDGAAAAADSFTYTVEDNLGAQSNLATVRITIEAPVAPTAADDAVFALFNSSTGLDVLANDTPGNGAIDPATVTVVTAPLNGSVTGINPTTGVVSYLHDGGTAAADSFTYTVDDVNGATSNPALVRITIGQIPAGEFVSDDFNACALDPVWTFVDPKGDATAPVIVGGYTGDAKLAISVPGGSSHELFNGVITAPYVIQETTDNDFTLEVKFDSVLPAVDFAEQGIIVRQDDLNWLRLEFYSRANNQLYVLAGLPNNLGFPTNEPIPGLQAGQSPIYMRIQRVGDTWTQSYSTDGAAWTALPSFIHPLTVTGVGVYGGNADTDPAHTVLVDYFSNTLAPVDASDDTGLNDLTISVAGNGSVDRLPDQPSYACGEQVQLTAVPDAGYEFSQWSGDATGSLNPLTVTMDGPLDVTATFVPSGPPEAPVAVDDAAVVVATDSVVVDVVANDTDANGDIAPGTVALVAGPLNGTVTAINPTTGAVTYTQDGAAAAADSFTYTVEDALGAVSNPATVRIEIQPAIAPTAADDAVIALFDGASDFAVLANDTPGNGAIDPATVTVVAGPLNGSITGINPADGVVSYLHDGGAAVADSFTYTVDDVHGATSNVAVVRISISQIPPGVFISDDFNACALDPVWTFVDPQGDATPAVIQGAYSGDARLAIQVPAGSDHELYNGIINAPHLIQATTDDDFTLEVKFDSVLPAVDYAEQGIIVRQDDANWLRLEFYSLGTDQLAILAGLPDNTFPNNAVIPGVGAGQSPVYMRVERVGDTWTQSYSTDGAAWTALASFVRPLTVTGVGVYGGNSGANPGHTVLVDYFSNSLAPVDAGDDTGLNALTVNVAGGGTVGRNPDQPSYACGEQVQLTATPDAGFAFDQWSGDATGSLNPLTVTMDGPLNVTATFVPTGPPEAPVAVDDFAVVVAADSVAVDVVANDTDANGDIAPGTVALVGAPLNGTITNIDPVTGHMRYVHDGGVAVADSFTYTVEDALGAVSNVATVRIQIDPPTPPVAVDDALTVLAGATGNVDVLANDSDSDGTLVPASVTVVDAPLNGTITGIDPGTGIVTYAQDGAAAAADSFTYTVQDNHGATSNPATVRITIEPLVAPTAVDDALVALFDSSSDFDILANDTPGNGAIDPATVTVVAGPLNGFITGINPADGVVSYLHDGGAAVADSFTYTVDDVNGATSNLATARITISQVPPGVFISDDFNACALDPAWTFVDPQGDTTPAVIQGAYTGDAKLAISVPAGGSHELYNGTVAAPYLIQATTDDDFTLEVKFDSVLPAVDYAEQGIIVRQDDANWLRLEFYSLATDELAILAGLPDNTFPNNAVIPGVGAGQSPMYMRVERVGDTWTQSYSTDGAAWTALASFVRPLTVTGVGVYGGNAGANPAHTVLVDYFSNSLAPVDVSDDTGLNALTVNVVGGGSVGRNPDQPSYACGEQVELTAVPDAGFAFDQWSGDVTGSLNPVTVTMNGTLDVTATFVATATNTVAANTSGVLGLSTVNTCEAAVPVEIIREGTDDMRAYSVTVGFSDLAPCAGVASFQEGTYLSSVGATVFQVVDNGNGTYDVDCSILDLPCGATDPGGVLFTVDVTNTISDGTGAIILTNPDLRDCDIAPLPVAAGPAGTITIDSTGPANVTGLAATQVMSGNPAGNVTAVGLAWTASADADAVETRLYRRGFGGYPEYDDTIGAAPAAPLDPLAEGWTLVTTLPATEVSFSDLPNERDFWYFCAVSTDVYGNPSTSLITTGTLNYLLGDVSDGNLPLADGDNLVASADISLLGNSYGTADGDALYLNTLDVGPTVGQGVTGRPTTDNVIEFEDLIIFSITFNLDATAPAGAPGAPVVMASPSPAAWNSIALEVPPLGDPGETFTVDLAMTGDGQVQALRVPLLWDESVVELVGFQSGSLLADQGGPSLVLSALDGTLDIALVGVRERGIAGAGPVAQATFRVLGSGSPRFGLGDITARDVDNKNVEVTAGEVTDVPDETALPRVSVLHGNYPNPFNPMTNISFDLATPGRVRVSIFSVDGRLVRTLVDESLAAGRHERIWAGRDDTGRAVASGTYLYRMVGPGVQQTRRMLLLK